MHVPQVDRMPEEAPPTVVAIVGPSGVSFNFQSVAESRNLTSNLFSTCTGRQDNPSQVLDPSLHQADSELAARSTYRGHHQAQAPHVFGMSLGFPCRYDRCGQDRRYRPAYD